MNALLAIFVRLTLGTRTGHELDAKEVFIATAGLICATLISILLVL